jgi:nicotinamide-nucleotide amidase
MTGTAVVLLTGSELLDGRLQDTNGRFLAGSLSHRGLRVTHVLAAPDDLDVLCRDLEFLFAGRPAVLVVCGGLGTTHDDLTTEAVARAAGLELVEDPDAKRYVEAATRRVAARRGLDPGAMLPAMLKQARLPAGSRAIRPAGVAPGFALVHAGTRVYVLPGVPGELEAMWADVTADLDEALPAAPRPRDVLRVYGVGEVQVGLLVDAVPHDRVDVAITASKGELTVVTDLDEADGRSRAQARALRETLMAGAPVFSADGRTVDEIVADLLRGAHQTVAVAESCTGGLLGARLTDLAGSSDYFPGGIVSYDDQAKVDLLRVPQATLESQGAVSADVARGMAEGARTVLGATYGVGITGVAGPGGGTPDKPVGLVFIACSGVERVLVRRHEFPGDRASVRAWAVTAALHLLRETIVA